MLVKGIMTQMSGSLGGITGSHNASGLYLRARAIPVNPNTVYQQAVRNAVSVLATRWSETLTQAQRDAWDVYAAAVSMVNALGDSIYISGLNHYIRSNVPRLQTGLPIVDDGPTVFTLASFTDPTFAVDEPNDEVDVSFTNTDDWANEDDAAMLVYASRPQSVSINYFKGPYRYAGKIDGDSVTPPTSPAAIGLPFTCTTGQRLFFKAEVSRADGRLSPYFRGSDDT